MKFSVWGDGNPHREASNVKLPYKGLNKMVSY